ncbi:MULTISPECIES: hypothetical protein [Natrinema]|uniref:Uncharacterized protein n=1 Tax=Natrinema gari JCM 14663 TaxID=1230459 RepID=L9ZCX7_9EURY|nr:MULTISPECIES: hypothetical protein [Natrinema]AFO56150.1 hypothetical protein NJ7G_0901 [Natrinema sp. J7-2]ELY83866.1 hypothetical protein C486_01514 [Natrinema gari JCM 14663]
MEFDGTKTAVAFLVVIALGVGGMLATPMGTDTILMMVAPSMIVFGLLMLVLGVKHGEYRATR